ncbi:hypothetical protein NSA25_00980 [Erysipelatoclostridium ramosum]|uniref:flavodoxin n=1 Tax=Thomasclavelia ramosa TaxID=1547 RepID=UPI00192A80DF|nr:flavodoxin [Thomasclavelia ramosa]MCR1946418.1 hypothetical protein [Thomasclavelia ramosa]QQY26347.1 hypothetical protein I6I63_09700 [Thomasclavelia ramosa]
MKKMISIIVGCIVLISVGLVYFGTSTKDTSPNENANVLENVENNGDQNTNDINEDVNSLVVYFSVPETDSPDNMTRDEDNSVHVVDGEVLGNTQYIANLIGEKTNSEVYRLEPVDTYPTNHDDLLERAADEMDNDERPEIKDPMDISSYDVIFIGYPIWNADLPPIINTFLENNNFDGKTIIPFCTHGGSDIAGTPSTIQNKLPDAKVIANGFEISRNDMDSSESKVNEWLSSIGY